MPHASSNGPQVTFSLDFIIPIIMAPEKKRKRQCQGCRDHFSNIASHWLLSSTCHAPGTSATGTAGRSSAAAAPAPGRTNVLLDEQQGEEEIVAVAVAVAIVVDGW